ncbi:MAG: amidohydrolase family protein [Ignavibacteria bacterium]|nr:amidohydrolase family protein [Ignavibacteria bacterium]
MIRTVVATLLMIGAIVGPLHAQTAPVVGLRENTPAVHAFVNARIVVAPGKTIAKGTLVVRSGVIEAVGENVVPPADARVWNMEGLTLYPGFIELSSDLGMPKPQQVAQGGASGATMAQQRQQEAPKGAAHWNSRVQPNVDASLEFKADSRAAEKLRSQGFALALATPQLGIFRGSSALVSLGDGSGSELVVKRHATQTIALEQMQGFGGGYPSSLMGVIALVRQTWYDADWYRKAHESYARKPQGQKRPETNAALEALQPAIQQKQPVVIEVGDDLTFLRAAKIGREFSLNAWIRGSGQEYRRLDAVKAAKLPVIVPVNFPEPPAVDVPEEALNATLEELRHWDTAPENASRLARAGVAIALTTAELRDPATFLASVRKAVERGLSSDAALAALTTNPAHWLGVESRFGTLEKGKVANIMVADGNAFDEKTNIREVWIDGRQYEVKIPPSVDARGTWNVQIRARWSAEKPVSSEEGELIVRGEMEKPSGTLKLKGKDLRLAAVTYANQKLAFMVAGDSINVKGNLRLSATVGKNELTGVGELPDGRSVSWTGARKEPARVEPDTSKPREIKMASFGDLFPAGEFGRAKPPQQPEIMLVKNAAVWTQGPQGKIENADLLVTKGKITAVGKNLTPPKGATVIDATGKHVTPGLIDCHSHTATASVNEGGQTISAETRIEDVLDSDDIWIYRQLAGGTTAANVLHGSANPIGGQNAVVKWRWGALPDEMLIAGAPPGIKFALGENVKQSNFSPGGQQSTRYPQTRMGVEQIIRDRFQAALDYERAWKEWEKDKTLIPPPRDLELDAVLEAVKGKRLVHAHSYRQDEILMLLRVAEEFGFRIATLQHVLEGYKVAEAIKKHGAGASSFSDWWAYKIEAWDAIPGSGSLMHAQGVNVSYNSDNSQLATRMNWEASKALKFGVPEQEALNFVTLNSAIQLGVQDRIGSLEVGKDADFVIWSGDPLSVYSVCEQTWVDGRKYFDLQEDRKMREQIQNERSTLIQKIIASKQTEGAAPGAGPRMMMRRPNEEQLQSCMEGVDHEY